jgi:hypothetical protein
VRQTTNSSLHSGCSVIWVHNTLTGVAKHGYLDVDDHLIAGSINAVLAGPSRADADRRPPGL